MDSCRICLRPATSEDVPFLLDLRQQTMNACMAASGRAPSVDEDTRRVLFRFDCAEIVELANEGVGLLKVSRDGTDWYLIQIQLMPASQSKGIGTQLIQTVINQARSAGASLGLNVLKVNPARHLYEQLGFRVVSETDVALEMKLRT